MQLPEDAGVLVLLVATDGASWLPETLRGLRAQKHRPIKVLAVDNASTDGSGAILTKAFGPRRVITLERRVGYGRALAAALKVASEREMEADAFLLLHDDAALREGALEAMVEALRGDHVGIVGCKLVDWEDAGVLQEVGRTTDRYGRQVPRVERGELDQGQYEGIEEVLYVTSAAMLIAREVVQRVGLFDGRYVVLRDDLDLCWRARLAGYRTVVHADVSARHVRAGERELRAAPPRGKSRYYADRNMIATLLKNYSLARLAVALPVTMLVSFWNVILFLMTGRRRSAIQVLQALRWNLAHLPSTVRARARAQAVRSVSDGAVIALMHHGASRLRAQFERAVETVVGSVDEGEEEEEGEAPGLVERLRARPGLVLGVLGTIVILIAARGLFGMGQLAGADLAPFPDQARELFASYASGWRGPTAGGGAPATPALALLGGLIFLCAGSGWMAQRVLLLGLPLLAGWMMARLGRTMGLSPRSRRIAGLLYALTPLVLGAYGAGSLSDLVLLAAAPGLVTTLLRAGGVLPRGGWRALATGIAGLSVAGAFAPWALVLVAGGGVVMAVCSSISRSAVLPILRRAWLVVLGALVLLLPWSIELFRPGSPLGAGTAAADGTTMRDLVALTPGAIHPVPLVLSFGVAVAAVGGALLARDARRALVLSVAPLGAAGLFAAWGVTRGVGWIAPRPALPLAVAAVAAAVLAGIGIEEIGPALRARQFGLRHVLTGVAGVLVLAQVVAAVAWTVRGDRPGVVEAGSLLPSFFAGEAATAGAFRVLWLAGTHREPAVALTGPAGATIAGFLAREGGRGAQALRFTVGAMTGGTTEAAGRMLATFGVRYVIVRPDADQGLQDAVARQTDLAFSQRFRDATIYRNAIDIPVATVVTAPGWVAAARSPELGAVAAAGSGPRRGIGFRRTAVAAYQGRAASRPGELLLAEDFSDGWSARVGERALRPAPAFGWGTRFTVPAGAEPVRVAWSGQRWHRAALLGQVLLIAAFGLWCSQRAGRDRGER